ncbi:hypothetical protein [Neisseria dentiae]|uniref:hypothetical protein n=1 Tax=Neisseria dentiae TaxID=194197 RepID=UPI00359FD218
MGMLFMMLIGIELIIYIPLAMYVLVRIFDRKTSVLWRCGSVAVAIGGIFVLIALTLEYLSPGIVMYELRLWLNEEG